MRRFMRTIAGKVLLFLLCILSVCTTVACAVGAMALANFDFYTRSERALKDDYLSNVLISRGDDIIRDVLIPDEYSSAVQDDTNVIYQLLDGQDNEIARSYSAGEQPEQWEYAFHYGVIARTGEITDIFYALHIPSTPEQGIEYYTIRYSLKPGLPEQDIIRTVVRAVHAAYSMRYAVYFIGLATLLLGIVSFVWLMCVSGRRSNTDEIVPGPLNRVPFDLLLAVCGGGLMLLYILCDELSYLNDIPFFILMVVAALLTLHVALGLCMSTAARIKQNTLFKNTVVWRCVSFLWRGVKVVLRWIKKVALTLLSTIRRLPMVWRTALILAGMSLLELIVILGCWWEMEGYLCFWILEKIVVIPLVLVVAMMLRKLQQAGHALAEGDLTHHTDTKGLFWDFKRHAEDLNSIAGGMAIAVEEKLKSERMKTELITNVSHDIKTPLTSVINYAGLIGAEQCENETIKEYAQVLVRQSERLKRLMEDLVEASRASSGNLEVELSACDASVFLTQASGEYEDKLRAAELTLVVKQPEHEVRIMADGRRMWRIFDNLMNNICKYAQSGTRVYLSLEQTQDSAVITFKNTSRDPLDLSEEELMERFTRGDVSRHTEGNGLGLSIARSMAELQHGELHLAIDGDLFKAVLTFPLI